MIVLEGPDGSGKSSLAKVLSDKLDRPIFHPGPKPFDDEALAKDEQTCITKLRQGFICDRITQISHYVYSRVIRKSCVVTDYELENFVNFAADSGFIFIFCYPTDMISMVDNQTVEEHDTLEHLSKVRYNHVKLCVMYNHIYEVFKKHIPNKVFLYDYKKDNEFERLTNFLEEKTNGQYRKKRK